MYGRSYKQNLFLMMMGVLLAVVSVADSAQVAHEKTKQQIVTSVENHRDELIGLSDQVWEYAEIALREEKSAEVLASYLEEVALGGDPADSLFSALEVSANDLEDRLRRHVGADALPTASLALDELGDVEISGTPSPPDETLTVLGDLASRLRQERQAEELYDLALAYDASNAEATAGLAGLRDDQARLTAISQTQQCLGGEFFADSFFNCIIVFRQKL